MAAMAIAAAAATMITFSTISPRSASLDGAGPRLGGEA